MSTEPVSKFGAAVLGVGSVVVDHVVELAHFPHPDTKTAIAARVEAIDTNGAGDVFCGALIARLATGESMSRAVRFATATAGLACQVRGNEAVSDVTDVATRLPDPFSPSAAID